MKWGILATGTIAKKFAETIQHMQESSDVVIAVASRKKEAAELFARAYGIPKFYGSYQDLCRDQEVEAVYIATPNNLHYENTRMCLESGKHVLCEKPFTIRAKEAEMLYCLAEKKGLFIMEAFWIRFLPVIQKLLTIIDSGEIGDVRHLRCDFGFVAKGERKDRKFDSSLGGGALLDIGIYNLGFAHMVMGAAPTGFTSSFHLNEYHTDDFSSILLEYPGGRTASVTTAIGLELPRHALISGTKGYIVMPDYQAAEKLVVHAEDRAYEVQIPFEVNGFEYQIRETRDCAAMGLSASRLWRPEDSLTVLKLMEDIRNSWDMKFSFEP